MISGRYEVLLAITYHLDSPGIPNALLQMAFNRLFIPLSMLTAATMDHIKYNCNLKYHKIVLNNGAGEYSLDESSFPEELTLNESEFWQAYRNWLLIISSIADTHVADIWRAHHYKMITDSNFSAWFHA